MKFNFFSHKYLDGIFGLFFIQRLTASVEFEAIGYANVFIFGETRLQKLQVSLTKFPSRNVPFILVLSPYIHNEVYG